MDASLRPLTFLFLVFLIIIHPNFFCNGDSQSQIRCIQTERNALLKFKQHLQDPSDRLASWAGDVDCCQWVGVVCHNVTGHVHQLHLRSFPPVSEDEFTIDDYQYEAQFQAYWRSMFGGKLNPSLLDLKYLNYLDLTNNDFSGTQIPKFLGSMESLRYLNLSDAGFGGVIPHQLGNLSNLNYLDLSYNDFSGTQIPKFLGSMESLRYLNLYNAGFGGVIPHQLGNLSNLQYLYLGGNGYFDLYVNNLQWLSALPLLQHLDMSSVNLSEASDWLQVTNKLPSLLELRLSYCELRFIPPTPSVNFSSLTTLDLSENRFENTSIPSWIVGLRNLVFLDLSFNFFQGGPIPVVLQNMTSLRHLDLSGNYFNHSIPNWLYSFSRLEFLNLGFNNLQGTISSAIANLTSAISIDLSYNEFSGYLRDELGQFKNLAKLSFQENSISGPIPVSLGNVSSLRYLDLSLNQFNGTLPQNFGQLSKLNILHIESNMLKGVVSEVHFSNLTRLSLLFAFGNQLTLKVSHDWIPSFQLQQLSLRSWNLGSNFPHWLCSQRHLQYLDISNTGISDMVPPLFWNLTSQLRFLNLSHNLIHGEIGNGLMILSTNSRIDLSSNHFKGPLPYISSNVIVLDLSNNLFSGSISHFLCYKMNETKYMELLNLGKNLLSEKIHGCWTKWQYLEVINLGNNNFTGNIPASLGSLPYLKSLHLQSNKLSCELPSSLKSCKELVIIDLSENEFVGSIPSWIGQRLLRLVILNLRSNNFHGHIPKELCALTSLQILDLSHNKLSGSIPRCVKNFTAMATKNNLFQGSNFYYVASMSPYYRALSMYDLPRESTLLVIKGTINEYSSILQLVKSIDFSKNNLSGEIPEEVTSLQGLQSLNFSYNLLIGSIPENIGTMGSLECIDFSVNQLSGQIPSSMSSLTFLNHLNLSNNNLIGKIPLSTQLQSLDASNFIGNKLCGPPLTDNCTVNGVKPNNENIGSRLEVDWFYVSMALGFVVGFWGVCGPLLLNKQWRIMYFQFLDHMGYKLKGVLSL